MRRRAAHDVALDVAAGGQRGKLNFVDAVNRLPQIVLQHAVQLQALAAGDAQRGVADFVAQIELGQQLLAGQLAAGNLGADHERVGLGALALVLRAAAGPRVAVVLLVGAVMLQQLDAGLAEKVVRVAQLRADIAAQVVALDLEDFDRAEFRLRRTWCGGETVRRVAGCGRRGVTARTAKIVTMISIIVIFIRAGSSKVN